jgi:mRNA interferase MazF
MKRFEVWLARLDPAEGAEMRKTRPVVIVSPDEMNNHLHTVLVAPLTTGGFQAPFRVPCRFMEVSGQVALDHVRSLSKARCVRCLGSLEAPACQNILAQLREMFAE